MTEALLVFQQISIMFILIGIGIFLTKKGLLTEAGSQQLSHILLLVVVPALIIHSFVRPLELKMAKGLLMAFILAIFFHLLAIACSRLIKGPDKTEESIARMGAIYSNCGFMAFPILNVLYGSKGIFYGTAFVAVFNLFLWSNGVQLIKPQEKISIKKCLLNPGCIPVMIGLCSYFLQIPYPKTIISVMSYLSGANTPLAMIIIGIFLADSTGKTLFKDSLAWKASIFRTLLIPLFFLFFAFFLNLLIKTEEVKIVILCIAVCGACPAASSIILIPSSMGLSGKKAAKIIFLSTLLSIITMPFITMLAALL